jgi:hyperosmotically inducible periplasmic protein
MKKLLTAFLVLAISASAISLSSCKKKAKDADIKAAIETALKADPMAAGTMVDVKDGIATISGECKDDMCKAACEKMVTAVKGVKSVVNNCTVAPPPAPVVIAADDPLTQAVKDALTAFPGVSATVKDGIISLTGQIAKADRQKLMMVLQGLKPKKVDPSALTNK